MNELEWGVLLLCCHFSEADTRPLTAAQFQELGRRVRSRHPEQTSLLRQLDMTDIARLGYTREESCRIYRLISREKELQQYLLEAQRLGITAVTRVSPQYPDRLRRLLGSSCPAVLFFAGNLRLLETDMISLVGSRRILPENAEFARQVGSLAAQEGFTLVSGGADGADSIAARACLDAGGAVITVVPDQMRRHLRAVTGTGQVLLCSEESYHAAFTSARAHSRNRIIHCLGEKTFVAQTGDETGGTWAGTTQNLKNQWSDVFIYDDQSPGARKLIAQGATGVRQLAGIGRLQKRQMTLWQL